MKKLLLTTLLISATYGLFAQVSKGQFALTGIFGLNGGKSTSTSSNGGLTITTNEQKNSGFAFVPAVSYFLSDRLEAGLAFAITKSKTETKFPQNTNPFQTAKTENTNPMNGFALLANYYFMNTARYACYAGIQLGLGSGKGVNKSTLVNGQTSETETKNSGSTFGFNTGFLYFVKQNLALNASLGLLSFNSTKSESTTGGTTNETKNSAWAVGVNGVVVNIGVKWFFGGNSSTPAPAN